MSSLMMPAKSVASLLAHVFGPSFYDSPHFGHGGVGWAVAAPQPDPWRAVALNPQPLPPRQAVVLALADAHVHQVLSVDRLGALLGGEGSERSESWVLRLLDDVEGICPRPPKWPFPGPPPPWPFAFGDDDVMQPAELLLFGSRILAASQLAESERVRGALTALGERAMSLSLDQETGS